MEVVLREEVDNKMCKKCHAEENVAMSRNGRTIPHLFQWVNGFNGNQFTIAG